jgi:hypothetical protein
MAKLGRPPENKSKIEKIICLSCGKEKRVSDFYQSSSVYNAGTNRVQYCKECCFQMSHDKNGIIDVEKFKAMLQKIDKPFLHDVLESAYEECQRDGKSTPFQLYFKNINSILIPAIIILGFKPNLDLLLQPVNLFNILFLGLGASALCFVTWNVSVKILGAIKTSVYIYMVPVITVVTFIMVLQEKITDIAMFGILLTLAGLFISEKKILIKTKGELENE